MKNCNRKFIQLLPLGLFLLFFAFTINAQEKTDETEFLGHLTGDSYDALFDEPFYFYYKNKNELHPFYLENYLDWKSELFESVDYNSEIENQDYCLEQSSTISLCQIVRPFYLSGHIKKISKIYLNQNKVDEFFVTLKSKIDRPAENAKLFFNETNQVLSVKTPEIYGYQLDKEKSYQNLKKALAASFVEKQTYIPLVVNEIKPKINSSEILSLGINKKIAQGQSNFAGSPQNRIHNIKTAVEKFDGYLLAPNEELSFTTILGTVDETTGYKEELVIKDNKTIPEFGGGICQVSTTLFRAALNAGFKITERRNHAYPVSYYSPQGTDATVYVPKPDLRFINDSPAYILIQARISGNLLYFDIFGTDDGRIVELDGPHVTEKTADNKLKTVLYQIVKDANGNEIRKDTFKSTYDDPAKYHEPEFKTKPASWSNKQWNEYKTTHGL